MTNNISFTIPGAPQGKGRPRFVRQTGRTYTPQKTVSYENLIKYAYIEAGGKKFDDNVPLGITVYVHYPIPKSTSKTKRQDMLRHLIRPTKKPDADNILKVICDALNHIAYRDDAQVVEADIFKFYGEIPRVEVAIWQL